MGWEAKTTCPTDNVIPSTDWNETSWPSSNVGHMLWPVILTINSVMNFNWHESKELLCPLLSKTGGEFPQQRP